MSDIVHWREQLDCRFPQVDEVFADCLALPLRQFDAAQMEQFIAAARMLGKLGRGPEPVLSFLEVWPEVAESVGFAVLPEVMGFVARMQRSPNGKAVAPLLASLAPVARRLRTPEGIVAYLALSGDLMDATTIAIHGRHATEPSPGLPVFLAQAPALLQWLSLAGLRAWVAYGLRHYARHSERQVEYFSLALPDSRAVVQRERHGTLFADVERTLQLGLRALWGETLPLAPISTLQEDAVPTPCLAEGALHLPDVYDDAAGVAGIDRYRLAIAHLAGHRRWSTPLIADNWSPAQRLAVEFFEDARIDCLLMRRYPGLQSALLALHPVPREGACDPVQESCLRHRLAMLSRAALDEHHGYSDPTLIDFAGRLRALLAKGDGSTRAVADLALDFVRLTRRQSDQSANVFFTDTVVDYRDDNRHLWRFIEAGDEEESFDDRHASLPEASAGLPPRHYPEWDAQTQSYRPDWVSLYEALHPAGDASHIERLLAKHAALARRLKQMLEVLKPQDKTRIRYQEDGSELDLDIALRSLIELRSGATPDPRITQSHRTDGRNIHLLVVLDLSESLKAQVPGSTQTVLELSQEAVSLLGWAVDCLGDPFAIAGFHSNTRHEVRYQHFKGFGEAWDETIKARLAAMAPAWSTRMGAALRHGGGQLAARRADKRILLLLTDGEPSDIDVDDPAHLRGDARKAVEELAGQGVDVFCLSLDRQADAYVKEIFGQRWQVLDRIDKLPAALTETYLRLTR